MWTEYLARHSSTERRSQFNNPLISAEWFSYLSLDIRSLGGVLGQPGTLARDLVDKRERAATVGPRTIISQVVIRNTYAITEDSTTAINSAVGRSGSLLSTTGRIPVLAPKRSERIHIEEAMKNIWTKDLLAYPVMTQSHGRAFASAASSLMMRKISRTASIASNLSKRSVSNVSISSNRGEDAVERWNSGPETPTPAFKASSPMRRIPERTSSTLAPIHVKSQSEVSTIQKRKSVGSLSKTASTRRPLHTRWSSPLLQFFKSSA